MELSEFVRIFPLRAPKLTWFFGAGSSVSAGMPSAYDLIWDFKRRIYCSDNGYFLNQFNNLADKAIRVQIQSYFDGNSDYPAENSSEEYSAYFEKAFQSSKDRSSYLEDCLGGLKLSFGHKVLGVLMKHNLVKLILTTNFDRAFENAAIEVFKNSDGWFSTDLDNADNGLSLYQSGKSPLIVKLHGDYFSDKLKNTSQELQEQDSKLRSILTMDSLRNGIGIMGYSGRDKSIMDALYKGIDQPNSFPNGIFWFVRSGSDPLASVSEFISAAKSKDIEAHIIEIDTFDSAWAQIIKGFDSIPSEDLELLNQNYFRHEKKPVPRKGTKAPLIRLNAVRMSTFPTIARLYKCEAGNTKEVRELINKNKGDLIAIRKRDGIVGFGSDDEFKRVFEEYGDFELETYELASRKLVYEDSSEKSLIAEAITKALTSNLPLRAIKRGRRNIIIPILSKKKDPIFSKVKAVIKSELTGKIPQTNIHWVLSLEISIQYKMGNAFLLLNPSVLATKSEVESERKKVSPFLKELMARWYNRQHDELLTAWLEILFNGKPKPVIYTFPSMENGVNASFKLESRTSHAKTV